MRMRPWTSLIPILITLAGGVARADDLRCNGSLIDAGKSQSEVMKLCGSPGYTASSEQEEISTLKNGNQRITYKEIEAWLYDLEDGSFLRSVDFANGVVQRVEVLRVRGKIAPHASGACFGAGPAIAINDPAELVGYLCGEPKRRRVVKDELIATPAKGQTRHAVRTEVWAYGTPSGERRLTVTGGKVVGIVPN